MVKGTCTGTEELQRKLESTQADQEQRVDRQSQAEPVLKQPKEKNDQHWNFPSIPRPPPPFPVKNKMDKRIDKEYNQFVEMMKNVNFSISAYELFIETPKYAKYFKTMLANKE